MMLRLQLHRMRSSLALTYVRRCRLQGLQRVNRSRSRLYSIIYNAIEEIRSAMEGMLEPKIEEKILGNVEIKETYKFDKATVAGCFVLDGKIARNNRIRLVRDGIVIFTGELGSLKRYRDDAKEVTANMECGISDQKLQ